VDRILKKLVGGGLVARKVQKLEDIGDQRKVYYEATRFGSKLLYTLYDSTSSLDRGGHTIPDSAFFDKRLQAAFVSLIHLLPCDPITPAIPPAPFT
jgi:hypothetical protein